MTLHHFSGLHCCSMLHLRQRDVIAAVTSGNADISRYKWVAVPFVLHLCVAPACSVSGGDSCPTCIRAAVVRNVGRIASSSWMRGWWWLYEVAAAGQFAGRRVRLTRLYEPGSRTRDAASFLIDNGVARANILRNMQINTRPFAVARS